MMSPKEAADDHKVGIQTLGYRCRRPTPHLPGSGHGVAADRRFLHRWM